MAQQVELLSAGHNLVMPARSPHNSSGVAEKKRTLEHGRYADCMTKIPKLISLRNAFLNKLAVPSSQWQVMKFSTTQCRAHSLHGTTRDGTPLEAA